MLPLAALACLAALLTWWAGHLLVWWRCFRGRADRRSPRCPSYHRRPEARGHREVTQELLRAVEGWAPSAQARALISKLREVPALPTLPRGRSGDNFAASQLGGEVDKQVPLDMNHVHLGLGDYMWAAHFVSLATVAMATYGLARMYLSRLLKVLGFLRPPSEEYLRRLVCTLVLETSLSIGFRFKTVKEDGDTIATFMWSTLIFLDDVGGKSPLLKKSSLQLDIDLNRKRIAGAVLDGTSLAMPDLLVLACHHLVFEQHPQIHAYANWGVDPSEHANEHSYLRRMGTVTAYYNHLGYDHSPVIFSTLQCRPSLRRTLQAVIDHSMRSPPPAHPQVRALAPHSRLVNFIVKLRGKFMATFAEMHRDFPSLCSGEAYFLGTVVHCLDHLMYARTLPRWVLTATDPSPKFASMYRAQEAVRSMFVEDLVGIIFPRYFKDAPTTFHRQVHSIASKIDPYLADNLQTCIVK